MPVKVPDWLVGGGGFGKLTPEEAGLDITNEEQRRDWEEMQKRAEDRRAQMSPPGTLGLPQLLEERRLSFGIPDAAFAVQPIFDACAIWQLPVDGRKKIGKFFMTDNAAIAQQESASIAVLCGAGPLALDHLMSNGVELGHFIRFVKLSPYRSFIGHVGSKPEWLLEVRAVHIRGSLDLRDAILNREVLLVETTNQDGFYRHHFKDRGGNIWHPTKPRADGSE